MHAGHCRIRGGLVRPVQQPWRHCLVTKVVAVAFARELVGFLSAVMRDAPEPPRYLPPEVYEAQYCAARSDSAALALK